MRKLMFRTLMIVVLLISFLFQADAQNTLGTLGLTSSNYASVAYSVRQLSTAYTGPLIRIRRSSDGNTYDVWPDATGQFSTTSVISAANPGTTPGTKNGTTALSTITSTTTFTVEIWYDQSGNGTNLTQSTATDQPRIINNGNIETENGKPFVRFFGILATSANSLNLATALSTNGHISVVNKFVNGGDGFILGKTDEYNWHSNPGDFKLFDSYSSTSVQNSTVRQNGTSIIAANAVWNTSLGVNTIQPQTANSGTSWDNIGNDRSNSHVITDGGGYAELVVFSTALSVANSRIVEVGQMRFYNLTPTITSLSSYSGDIGSTVTITGFGFDATAANNKVYFGSTKATVSEATTTSITVTVPTGAIYGPVTVINTTINLQTFSLRPFNVTFNGGNSVIAFKPSLNFTTSSANVGSSVGADFDGDGKTDLATVVNGSNIVNVFRNTNSVAGTPSFGTALALTPGSTCKEGIAVADFNGDGLMDLVVANNGNGTVAVFRNTSTSGTISFAAVVTFTVGSTPRNIAVGDFDNDGKMDIACPSSNASNNYLSILRNSGTSTSTISFDAQSTIAMGNAVSSVAAGDLDGDGKTDLIVGNDANNLPLRVLRNTNTVPGTLSFASYFTINLAVNTPFVALADFDSDGKLDIVSGNSPVYVVRNISTSGSLSASSFDAANKVSAFTGLNALQIVVGDLNGDGKPDIANYSGNAYFTIAKNTTSGSTISFASQQNVFQAYTTAPTIQGGFIGDLDGDNQPDLVSTNYGRTNFTVHSFVSASISSFSPANGVVGSSVTITGTGFNTTTSNNIVYFGTTIATVTEATATSLTVTVPTGATRAPISVINTATNYRAESKNLFQVNFTGGNNKIMLSNQVVATTGPTYQTAIADFNNDGFADIAVANRATTNKLSVFRNTSSTGASTISLASSLELTVTGTNINGVAASDFDGDGKIDLVCTYYGAAYGAVSKLTLYRNTTTAGSTTLSFAAGVDIDLSNIYVDNSMVLKVRDFNGDGRPDILFSANKLVLNNITAPGAFTTTSFVTKGLFDGLSYWPTTGYVDVDGDGFLDLVNSTGNTYFYVKRNTGALGDISLSNNQSFETPFSFSTYGKIFQGGAEGDLDGDGKVDLVFMDDGNTAPSNQVIVLRNTSTSGTINANSFSSKLTLGPVAGVGATTSGERCWIGLEDMDGDGRLDIIAVPRFTTNSNHTHSPTITVYLNKATSSTISGGAFTTASFSSAYAFGNLGTTTSFSIGDLNNDGKPEIVVGSYANNGFSIFRNYTVDPPTITSLDTYSGAVGSTVVITGTNFSTTAANNLVFFGATQAAVPTSVTSTSLTVTVPTGATYQPVSVTNTENTHIAYSPKPFLVTFTGGSNSVIFKSPVSIATTSAGNAIGSALGDLDGDGKMDLVELLNSGTLTIYRNTSTSGTLTSSSFTKVTDITSAGNYAVKIADIDGDGKMDIVTNQRNNVGVLRNTTSSYGAATPGTISFATIVSTQLLYGLGTNGGLEVADMDGDGKPDIIMSNNDASYSTYIVVAKNTSTIGVINSNSFNLAYSYTTVNQSIGLAVSDLDGDGLRDIAVVNYATTGTNPNSVVVLRNTSSYPTMSFATGVAFTTGTQPISVAIGDIDNDNKPDMVVANYGSTSISLFRNTSTSGTITTGSFAAKVDFTTPANPYAVALADINGDGKLDINVVNQGNASFASIFRNTATDNTAFSSSTLATRVDNTVVTNPSATSIAIGDIDGNGKNDMVVGNSNGTFYLMKYAEPLHTITSFSPTSGNVGATVTITGTNFPTSTSNIAVYFGATKATVSAATSTQITVTVPTGATFQPITVLNIAEGNIVSSVKPFTPTFTGGNNAVFYSKKVDFTTGTNPNRTYLADIDGDGKSDLIVPNYGSSSISVFRNTSTSGTVTTGSFGTKVDFTVSNGPASVAIGDIDNDGKLDIAVATFGVSTISILRNTATSGTIASSSFATHFTIASGANPTDVAIFDVDGDGRSEIISVNNGSTNISVFQNLSSPGALSSSSFASAVNLTSTSQPLRIAVGDFDNDGKLDFAVAATSSNTVSLFRNTSTYGTISTSSFATKQDITGMPSSPYGIAAGDIDGDGNVDLVVSANAGNTVSLLRNTFTSGTTFSFATKVDISAGSTGIVFGVALGDLDGDGKLDLVAANQASNTLSFFRNTATSGAAFSSTSTFATMVSFETGTNPQSPAIGDVDGDGKADVVVSNYGSASVSVLRYSTSNAISVSSFSPTSGNVGATVTITGAGFNTTAANNIVNFGATKATVSAATATSLTVTVPTGATHQPITVLNTTEGLVARSAKLFIPTFTGGNNTIFYSKKVDFTTASNPYRTYLADIDGDGKLDLAVANYGSSSISVFRNTTTSGTVTSGSFGTKVDFTVGTNPTAIAIADIDGDGKLDLAVANYGEASISILRNTATSGTIASTSFATHFTITAGTNPNDLAIFDVDGDGRLEIIAANRGSTNISVFKNNYTSGALSSSSFASAVNLTSTTTPQAIAVGDFDNDGKIDFAVAAHSSNTVSLFRNTSTYGTILTSSFATKQDITSTLSSPNGIAAGDIDGDGNVDLVVSGNSGNKISLLRNTFTSGTSFSFATKVDVLAASISNVQGVALGDLDGDGKLDLVSPNSESNTLSFFRNTATSGAAFSSSTFAAKITFATGTNPLYPAIGDVDGDGKADVVVPNFNSNTISVMRYNSDNNMSVSSFTPTSGAIGTTVTISGSGFNATAANNIVYFGATKATVSAASATSLTVTVPAGATFQPINVVNTDNGLTAASTTPFKVTFTGGNNAVYASLSELTSGNATSGAAIGDFNRDGKADIVVAKKDGTTKIGVFRNISTSGSLGVNDFDTRIDFDAFNGPNFLTVVDLDGDGMLDVALTNATGSIVSLYRNTSTAGSSTISFAAKLDVTVGTTPYGITSGDLDGDGKPELIVSNYGSASVSVLYNQCTKGVAFTSASFATKVDFTTGTNPYWVAVSDLDGDSKLDIAVTNYSSTTLSLFRNTGFIGGITTSSFASKVDYTTGTNPMFIALGDVNGDNKDDIAVSNYGSNTISLFRNQSSSGAFTFDAKVDYTSGTNPSGIAMNDLDGDGKLDIAFSNRGSNSISVIRNTSTGTGVFTSSTFATKADFGANANPLQLSIGDLDGDGKPDLVVPFQGTTTMGVYRIYVNNPPTITSFTPTSGAVGTSVTITGTNFSTTLSNNKVFFGATQATVSAATATSLTVTVPNGATYQPITVLNGIEGLQASSAKAFTPTFTGGNNTIFYSNKVDFTTATNPNRTYLADIDSDGKSDLIVPNYSSASISVFRNTSTSGTITSGSFGTKVDFTVGTNPTAVAIADIDGDGKLDLAVANYGGASISILRNTATSGTIASTSFATHFTITAGTNPIDVAIFDIEGDGRSEIIATNYGSTNISLFQNFSVTGSLKSSSFGSAVNLTSTAQPYSIAVADFNNDGKTDFAVTALSSNTISLFRNVSTYGSILTSSFATRQDITSMPSSPNGIAAGDIDGDGKVDLVVSANAGNTVSLLRNTFTSGTTFSFATKVDLSAGSSGNVQGVSLGDLDGDGKLDLVAANTASSSLSFFRNTASSGAAFSSSTFATRITFATATTPQYPAIGDVDGDGKADVVVSNYGSNRVSVFRYNPSLYIAFSAFTPASGTIGTSVTITGAGFDATAENNVVYFGDTRATITAASTTSLTVTVPAGASYKVISVLNKTNNVTAYSATPFKVTFAGGNNLVNFSTKVDFTSGTNPMGVAFGDFDGDGKTDAAVANFAGNNVSVYRNTATSGSITSSSFNTKVDISTGTGAIAAITGDIDGDGKLDLLVANRTAGTVSIFVNTSTSGAISFATKVDVTTSTSPKYMALGDFDADGKMDLAVICEGSNAVDVFGNNSTTGTLSFATKVTVNSTAAAPNSIAVADVDADDKPELVVTSGTTSGTARIFKNTSVIGSIAFATTTDLTTGSTPYGVTIGDIDGDGLKDIAVANNGSNTMSVFRNTNTVSGTVSFATKIDYTTGTNPYGIAIGDLDGDNKLDLVTANSASSANSVSVFRNTTTGSGVAFSSSTFATKSDFTVGSQPYRVEIADVDGNGRVDVITSNYNAPSISVLWNKLVPSITSTGTITTVCYSAAAQTSALPYTAASENPTAYSITWNAAALTAGLVNVATTNNSFVAGGGSITGIPINAGLAAGTYTGTMTITDGSSSSTLTVTLTVNAAVTAGTISNAQTICSGATPATITSTGVGTGSGTISYEWQTNASGSYVTIAGAVSTTYSPSALTATTSYKRRTVAINSGTTCYSDYTTPITITVNPLPNAVITSSSGGFSFNCTVSAPITLSVTPQTGNVYSWKIGTTEVSTTSSVSVSTPAAYTLTVTGTNGCIASSSATVINDYNAASAAVLSGTTSIPKGTSANLSVAITGGTSPFTVVYSDGTTNYPVTNYVSGSNIAVSPTVGTNYTLVSVTGANGCTGTGLSGSAYVTVTTGPTSSVISGSTSICAGGSTNISFAITGGTSPYTVVYTDDITSTPVTLTNYVSGTNVSVTPTGSVTTYSIVSVTDATGFAGTGNTGSAVMTVFATTTPTFTSAPGSATCGNTDVTYTTQSGMTNYIWTIPGTLNTDYTITSGGVGTSSNSVVLKWITAGTKVVTVNYLDANGCRSTTASSTTQNARAFTSVVLSGSTTITVGSSANLQVAVNGGTGPYTIVLNDGTADFTVNNYFSGPNITVTPTVTTTYTLVSVTGTTGCGSSSSSGSAVITVNSGGVAKTWTGGAGDNLWSSSGNWSPAGTPAGNDLISISSGNPIIDVDFTVGGTLTLSGATTTLTINPEYSISVASGATVDFGQKDVTFKSTAAGTAQLGRMEGTLSNADSVIVERYFPAGRRAYRFIAPSVTTTSSMRYNWMENATPIYDYTKYTVYRADLNYNPKPGYGTHITGTGDNTNGFDRTALNTSTLYTLNPTTQAWVAVGSTAGNLTAGNAYRILIRGDRSINLNNNNTFATSTTIRAKGTPRTGSVSVSSILSTVADGWSLVGNPYNALVDLRAASSTNLSTYYHVWDPQRGTRGAYVSYHLSTGYKSNSASEVNEYVQPGQAFFVQTVANGPASLTFEENKKAPAGTQTRVFRPVVNYPVLNVSLNYTDSLANGAPEMDALAVLFDNSFSNNVDANDAKKNYNQDENMGISRDGKLLSMELRNMYDQNTTIPLSMTNYVRQNYTIRINWSNPIDAGYEGYLRDNYLGTTTSISFGNSTDYVFTVNSSIAASIATDRFNILFLPSAALPVSGLVLNGAIEGKQVKLQFDALNERDMVNYTIERSADGMNFTKIGVQAAVNSNVAARSYAFIDNNPVMGNNYYRINGASINGQIQFSNVKLFKLGTGLPTVTVAPNPANNEKLQLKVTQLLKGNYTVTVTDALGRVFLQKEVVYDGNTGKMELKFPSVAKSGSYYVKVNGEGGSFTQAFIIR